MTDKLGRRAAAALLALLMLLAGLPAASAEAEDEGIELAWELGIRSVQKHGKYARLQLVLTNRTGRDLRGDVVFAYDDGEAKEIAVPVELPADTPIVVDMTVPGMLYNKDNNRIRFEEGGAGSGREIGFLSGRNYLVSTGVTSTTVGIVARDPDTLNVLSLLNSRGYDIRTVPIGADDLPEDPLQLDSLDILALNDVPTGGWPRERIDAIRSWVIRGGVLIVSGGAGYAKTAEAFADLVPVAPDGTGELESAAMLEAIGGEPLKPGTPVTVATGTLQAGSVTLQDGVIVSAVRPYGAGKVLYVAFDPSVEPLASWGGSAKLWERLLTDVGLRPAALKVNYGYGYDFWLYDSILGFFPSIRPPAVGSLSVFFIVYALLAAPVLYLVLRKFDRREWMWWLVPVFSVLCSVVIFAVGSADKREVKAHSVRTVNLAGDGWADRYAGAAVFVPSGGRVRVDFRDAGYAVPLRDESILQRGVDGASGANVARMEDGRASVVWRNVPYWSFRKAWVHLGASPGYGQFDVKPEYSGGLLDLAITNHTAADLRHVHVLVEGRAYSVGDLKRGESGTVRIPHGRFSAGFGGYGPQIFPYQGRGDEYARERGLIDIYLNELRKSGVEVSGPVIIGFSHDGESWFEVNGSARRSDNVTLWTQMLDFSMEAFEAGASRIVKPVIVEQNMKGYGVTFGDPWMQMTDGTLVFEFPLPWRDEPIVSFTVRHPDPAVSGSAFLSVWNEAEGDWELIPIRSSHWLPGPADAYITERRTVRMRLEAVGTVEYRLPDLELEGGTPE
ncbi:MAG: hypothetical protein A9Z00_14745 [Thermobacillus sp. ZCTH02-B1]|uniref:DUF4350 domain-containing protein n=1 Tax=Thermobacillus sp. ZCTH02-B1 TaxID=1858795 RepID=UPI000B571318|nr:hypothetical protein [Thermobacillus sp. ZCTH02-B1]OUM95208.1 MAG: hypothetical protein A9Z00_14745 [Thermobacillus sp. ZCTH02-B1]